MIIFCFNIRKKPTVSAKNIFFVDDTHQPINVNLLVGFYITNFTILLAQANIGIQSAQCWFNTLQSILIQSNFVSFFFHHLNF